jgi:flavodoxin
MEKTLANLLAEISIGPEQFYKNMAIFPLLAKQGADIEFITLDEALAQGALVITEINESGHVPELMVVNNSRQKILLIDGEELVGAKQNRVLNVTILLAPNSETMIPVSCIEQGRWSYASKEFSSANRTMSADLRKKKTQSVHNRARESGSFASNQGEIWEEISLKFERCQENPSPTMALSDLFEAKKETSEDYLKNFSLVDRQMGLAVFIDGNITGVEFLGRQDKFQLLYHKLVSSYVMDALENDVVASERQTSRSFSALIGFLADAANSPVDRRKSVSLGWDVRLESEGIVGAGLEFEQQILQLSLFQKDIGQKTGNNERLLRRASGRRNSILR